MKQLLLPGICDWRMVTTDEWHAVCEGKPIFNGCTTVYLRAIYGEANVVHRMGIGWFRLRRDVDSDEV